GRRVYGPERAFFAQRVHRLLVPQRPARYPMAHGDSEEISEDHLVKPRAEAVVGFRSHNAGDSPDFPNVRAHVGRAARRYSRSHQVNGQDNRTDRITVLWSSGPGSLKVEVEKSISRQNPSRTFCALLSG